MSEQQDQLEPLAPYLQHPDPQAQPETPAQSDRPAQRGLREILARQVQLALKERKVFRVFKVFRGMQAQPDHKV
jgi:hypothetical protein